MFAERRRSEHDQRMHSNHHRNDYPKHSLPLRSHRARTADTKAPTATHASLPRPGSPKWLNVKKAAKPQRATTTPHHLEIVLNSGPNRLCIIHSRGTSDDHCMPFHYQPRGLDADKHMSASPVLSSEAEPPLPAKSGHPTADWVHHTLWKGAPRPTWVATSRGTANSPSCSRACAMS